MSQVIQVSIWYDPQERDDDGSRSYRTRKLVVLVDTTHHDVAVSKALATIYYSVPPTRVETCIVGVLPC